MRIEWVIGGKGGDVAEVGSAERAHTALCRAVQAAYADTDPGALETLLGAIYGLRLTMVTDGQAAVERGREWTAQVGAILIRLSP